MKKIVLLLSLLITSFSFAQEPEKAWNSSYKELEGRIKAPSFKEKDYLITRFGAQSNQESKLNHKAINKAIEKCSQAGGGRVVIPAGVWHTGPLLLKSNVNLHLEEGATLLFTKDLSQYPLVLTRWEGLDCYNYQPMIYAYDQTNVAITGKGVIDGGATRADWWAMCGAIRFGWKEGMVSQRTGRPLLMKWAEDGVPVADRKMGDGYGMRVQLINLYKCTNVLIEGVTLLRSPFWVIHPLLCTNLIVRSVHVDNDGPNGDGCDPESCKDVLIENCTFNTGDDCIAIKSGRNTDGRLWNVPSENIIVRNCKMLNGHGGVVVGSEISGGCKNVFVENCTMDSPMLDRVIRIKTNTCRGGVVEGIYVRNIKVGICKEAVLKINLVYDPKEICGRNFPPIVRHVYLDNVNSEKSDYGIVIEALPDSENVLDINVSNCSFKNVANGGNKFIGKMRNIKIENVTYSGNILQ